MLVQRIGQAIQHRRKELKITQSNLSELAGIGANSLSRIEKGETNPRLATLEKIADVLGMELKIEVKKLNT
jgi:y4mF family transcriptional regulator